MNLTNHNLSQWNRREVGVLLAAGILVLVSRLPWITAGPGTDPDSFRVFNVARSLVESGGYSYSRPPGYPVYEYLVATIVNLGATWTNMISALFSVIAFVFFAVILRRSRIRPYLLGSLGFAFTPVVYVNSTSTVDLLDEE